MSFDLNSAEKLVRVSQFCDMIEAKYQHYELSCFLYEQREYFFNNRVGKNYIMKNGTVVPEGMKLLKAFRYFEPNKDLLRRLQDEASAVIQEDKITGTLCFSVHPLDFLSSSENQHKWRSCHALDGEFRSGNLSYMLDECTFMCYLKSDEMTVLPNFPSDVKWNNKKWRTLLFLNDTRDMMFAGRQYPFVSETGIEFVKEQIAKYFPKIGKFTPWRRDKIRSYNTGIEPISFTSPYIGVSNKLLPMKTLIKDANPTYPLHFNDLLKSSCYDPMYAYKISNTFSFYTGTTRESVCTNSSGRFVIGHDVKCLCCGQENIDMSELMTCTKCELEHGYSNSDSFNICPCCGNRFLVDEGYFVDLSGELVCDRCGDEYVVSCDGCGETGYKDSDDMYYDEERKGYFCKYCW